MKIIYKGNLPHGYVKEPISNSDFPFERGKPINVPDALGRELIKQDDWQAVKSEKEKVS